MVKSSVILERFCDCLFRNAWKVRFYDKRIDLNTKFDDLPEFIGMADLLINGRSAHVTRMLFVEKSKFKRMHHEDIKRLIEMYFPCVEHAYWERHKNGKVVTIKVEVNNDNSGLGFTKACRAVLSYCIDCVYYLVKWIRNR